jgi:hypothetical protein
MNFMPVALSETEIQTRLAEMKSCVVCGKLSHTWVELNSKSKGTFLSHHKSDCCGIACARRLYGRSKGIGRPQPGMKFNRWTVVERNIDKTSTRWLCRCDCGNESLVYTRCLMSGQSSSCGCLRPEKQRLWVLESKISQTAQPHVLDAIGRRVHDTLGRLISRKVTSDEIKRRLSENVPCRNCGKPVYLWVLEGSFHIRKKAGGFFCNPSCANNFYIDQKTWLGVPRVSSKKRISAFGENKSLSLWVMDERCVVSRVILYNRLKLGWQTEFAIMIPNMRPYLSQKFKFRKESRIQSESLMQDVVSGLAALAS